MSQGAGTAATIDFLPGSRLPPPTVPTKDIAIAAPPQRPRSVRSGSLARLLPVVSTVATVAVTAVVLRSGNGIARNLMFVIFPMMMLVSAVLTALAGRGHRRANETDRDRADYLRYLSGLRVCVAATAAAQRSSLAWCHPGPNSLWALVGGRRMWERRATDSDFCRIRLGVGAQPLAARLVVPEVGADGRTDPVTATAVGRFVRAHSTIPDAPLTIGLPAVAAVTIDGEPEHARALLRAMVCQLAVLHGPDRLLIVGAISDRNLAYWDWLKWLPHNQHPNSTDTAGPARMVYPDLAGAEDALSGVLRDRKPFGRHDPGSAMTPHVVVVVDGALIDGHERIIADGGITGVSILEAGIACDPVAESCGWRLRLTAGQLEARAAGGNDVSARPDQMDATAALVCARRLAGYRFGGSGADHDRPPNGEPRWHDLVGIGDPATFDPKRLWLGRNRRDHLRVPVGTTVGGASLELDVKEAAEGGMGPHGLCVGATGSGKSEFLRTVVLGMIARHSPDVLNLVLVDFKGGATFLGLEQAPHVAAVITNLSAEAPLVARMTDALAGEMNRRQELLRAAGHVTSVAAYERARGAGAPLAPLPALFIIVDEFSELLSNHPDFAELFSAIGRLGRSLGMHLLLASQRIDEGRLRGLEAHLSYRVCLKTLSAGESRLALGTPDACQLPNVPGAGYLRSPTGELHRFQTAFVSGPCAPGVFGAHSAPAAPDCAASRSVQVFTAAPAGPVTASTTLNTSETRNTAETVSRTVMDAVLARVVGQGPPAHQVWLPPLGVSPALDSLIGEQPDIAGTQPLVVPIGIVDRPFEQQRTPLIADLSGAAGNIAVVGAPQSGKSITLRTLITALAGTHDPHQVQFYCLDFGGGALAAVRSLPHVGSIAGRARPDLVTRTLAEMESIIAAREMLFRGHGVESMAHYRRLRARRDPISKTDRFGDVFLVIDGWATLHHEFDTLEAPITALAARGLSYGVHVVLSASRWAEIRPALKDQIGTRIELRLGDPADSEVDRKQAGRVPEGRPGRGLSQDGLHMVIALPRLDGVCSSSDLADAGARVGEVLRRRHGDSAAPEIPLLPTHVDQQTVVARAAGDLATRILLGLEDRELAPVPLDFDRHVNLLIFGDNECGKTTVLRTLCREIIRTKTAAQAQLFIVDFRRALLGVVESDHLAGYVVSASALTGSLADLLATLRRRLPGNQVTQQQLRTRSWWSGPDVYVVVDDYDLVATAAGNPLAPVFEYLPHAGDLGLHLVVARRSGGAARAMFEPLLAGLRDLGCMGLMMSADPAEGPLLGSAAPARLPPGRGTLITRTDGERLVQVGWSPPP